MASLKKPRRLAPGDKVALVAAAGPLDAARIADSVALLERAGLTVASRPDAAHRVGYLAASDATRLKALSDALRDPSIAAVFLARGGYGTQRVLPSLDLPQGLAPKIVVGFSDNTALLTYLQNVAGWAALHAPHPGGGPEREAEYREVFACLGLFGPPTLPGFSGLGVARGGPAVEAPVTGGCLSLLSSGIGTPYAPRFAGKIAFLEDVGEPVYRIDRYLNHLLVAGCFDGAAGVVFGSPACFLAYPEDLAALEGLIADFAARMTVPVLTGLPCGHVDGHRPLPLGVAARLNPRAATLTYLEPYCLP